MGAVRGAPEDDLSVVVSVDDSFVQSEEVRNKVITDVERAGLEVVKVLRRIGIVTGRVRASNFARLGKVEHVVSVEPDTGRSIRRG